MQSRYTNICRKAFIHASVRHLGGLWAAEQIATAFPHLPRAGWDYITRLSRHIHSLSRGRVYSGPFAEMRLPAATHLADRPFWVLGCYEEEIHTPLSDIITSPPSMCVDIGSAHGFYLVGLATQLTDVPMVGFEACEAGHWQECRELAVANGVAERITQKGCCDTQSLRDVLTAHAAVLCDCEGAELDILDPSEVPALSTSRIICEVHEFFRPGVTKQLVKRFRDTHDITLLYEHARDPNQFRILNGLSFAEKWLAVTEPKFIAAGITAARYLWMKPKRQPLASL